MNFPDLQQFSEQFCSARLPRQMAFDDAVAHCPALEDALQFLFTALTKPGVPYEVLGGLVFANARMPGLFPADVANYGLLLKLPPALQDRLDAMAAGGPFPANPWDPQQLDTLPQARWSASGTTLCVPLQAVADVVEMCAPYSVKRRGRPIAKIPLVLVAGQTVLMSTFTPPPSWDDSLFEHGILDCDSNDPSVTPQARINRLLKRGKRYSFLPWNVPAVSYAGEEHASWPIPPALWMPVVTWLVP